MQSHDVRTVLRFQDAARFSVRKIGCALSPLSPLGLTTSSELTHTETHQAPGPTSTHTKHTPSTQQLSSATPPPPPPQQQQQHQQAPPSKACLSFRTDSRCWPTTGAARRPRRLPRMVRTRARRALTRRRRKTRDDGTCSLTRTAGRTGSTASQASGPTATARASSLPLGRSTRPPWATPEARSSRLRRYPVAHCTLSPSPPPPRRRTTQRTRRRRARVGGRRCTTRTGTGTGSTR